MAGAGRFDEEWELEATEYNFGDTGEDVRWVGGDQPDLSTEDLQEPEIKSAPYDWRRHRQTISPLEGAQREAETEERSKAIAKETSECDETRNTTETYNPDADDRQQTSTGGDQFQAMEDGYGEGETYYYDEDLTRAGRNSNAEMRDRTTSDADLIFRTSPLANQHQIKSMFRYSMVALAALAIGILLGVFINMATNTCPQTGTINSSNSTTDE